ncbi:hypothetical protein Smic_11710 [Streptomyces microflavus]|uniref:uroporphyrinogen-III C-methyltransferase n=1 Tax=Streptomyces microflavus TaxID=1919 RepID=A0A7J0CLG9_STRMI|nr:hypothetical protein Smic_11710 [Streptomyces microflavus]
MRGRRLLAEADVVIADRLGPRDLLDELPPHVEVIDAAKIPYGRFMAQEAINQALIEHAKAGKAVVRLKGGDPFVFGRGMEEAQALAAEGIPCTVVPGISSTISVPERPVSRSPTGASPTSSPWSAAMSPLRTRARWSTGRPSPGCAAPSSC